MSKEVRISIDWLRYSMPVFSNMSMPQNIRQAIPDHPSISLTGETLPNTRGYDTCLKMTIGRVHYHSERPQQMISVEFSGKECQQLHALGFNWAGLWEHIAEWGGHLTTVHFAIDVIGYGADHVELEEALQTGKATTKARSVYSYLGGEVGKGRTEGTTYVGKPTSERQLRCYNKGAEQGTQDDWTRIELVIKGKRAKSLLDPLMAVTWPVVARSTIGAFVEWSSCEWWQAAMKGEAIKMPRIGREDTKSREWLLKQCLPTLKRELASDPEAGRDELAQEFQDVLDWYRRTQSPPSP